jgi:serine/threonine-protein kinase
MRMELIVGETLERIVARERKVDWRLATSLALQVAEALGHVHAKGIVHRDVEPRNIMFANTGITKLVGFGLAKMAQAATKVSISGQIVGTPLFMSPEQAGGKPTDARSDIYSLGVTYYYLLTGIRPFAGKNIQEVFLKHFFYTPESPTSLAPEVPEQVSAIVGRCLKKKKGERYQSAGELADELRRALPGD